MNDPGDEKIDTSDTEWRMRVDRELKNLNDTVEKLKDQLADIKELLD